MLIISLYLVIAPIVDNPQIEYLYSIIFMAVGAVLYVPFVYLGYVFKFMDKVTTFLQVWKKQNNLYFYNFIFLSSSCSKLLHHAGYLTTTDGTEVILILIFHSYKYYSDII